MMKTAFSRSFADKYNRVIYSFLSKYPSKISFGLGMQHINCTSVRYTCTCSGVAAIHMRCIKMGQTKKVEKKGKKDWNKRKNVKKRVSEDDDGFFEEVSSALAEEQLTFQVWTICKQTTSVTDRHPWSL